ncbi:MAG: hypothetical protein EOM87_09455 [Clostridia bacterium]|nr:hypothetical protein [Clostridia bacterium]
MRGNRRCLIEGVNKLLRYDDNTISVSAGKLTISITGSGLTLDCLADNRIGVKGEITSVTFGACDVV